jgi:hypothetical protein
MRLLTFFILISLASTLLISRVSTTFAQTSGVKINEFAAITNGNRADPDWIELYNKSNKIISLEGWKLRDSLETSPNNLSGCISPGGFRKFTFSTRLNNGGDDIRLFDKNNNLIDSLTYFSEKIPSHEKGQSTGRDPDGSAEWKVFSTPTPKNTTCKTSSTSSQSYPKISLSEIFANPEKGGREWVEIFNPSNSKTALTGWQLVDAANHKKELSGSVAGKSYKVFYYSSSWLNNSGDELKLLNPTGKQVEKYSFGDSEKGTSFAKDSTGKWKITTTPTPGKTNKITGEGSSQSLGSASSDSDPTSTLSPTGLDSTFNYLSDTFAFDNGGGETIPSDNGKIAGVSEKKNQKNSLAVLLIAAGVAFVGTAIAWPFLEKRKIL